jgi:hypothetical protein
MVISTLLGVIKLLELVRAIVVGEECESRETSVESDLTKESIEGPPDLVGSGRREREDLLDCGVMMARLPESAIDVTITNCSRG